LHEYSRNSTDVIYYSNYTINYSRSRYVGGTLEYNLTKSEVVEINLSSDKGIVRYGSACTSGVLPNFCVDMNPKQKDPGCLDMKPGEVCEVSFIVNATDNGLTINSSSLHYENFSFFAISESTLPEVGAIESDLFNITIVPDYS
jgi:hypothetical protein